jgi:molybdate transport system substrate-binding protein
MRLKSLLVSLLLLALPAIGQELRIAAAADLNSVLPSLVQQFEKETGARVVVSYGSSGNFYQQLLNGAPFDVFLSADVQYPKKLEEQGRTVPGTLSQYATGKIVLWARNDSGIEVATGLKVLGDPAVKHIAIGNPEHAPYGRAAVAALKSEHIYEKVAARLVMGENISQAAQFAQTGNAEVGIIAMSLALTPSLKSSGGFFVIPQNEYPPIAQGAVVMKSSKHADVARRFLEFLGRPASQELLKQFGFGVQ